MTKEKYWGYHCVLNCSKGNDNILDKEVVTKFLKDLVVRIKMVPFGEPWVERFATHCVDKAGISAVQMIQTSNITLHFVDSSKDGFLDVFSCLEFDQDIVVDCVKEYFNFERIEVTMLNRRAPTGE